MIEQAVHDRILEIRVAEEPLPDEVMIVSPRAADFIWHDEERVLRLAGTRAYDVLYSSVHRARRARPADPRIVDFLRLAEDEGLPAPDHVLRFGDDEVQLTWHGPKLVVVIASDGSC